MVAPKEVLPASAVASVMSIYFVERDSLTSAVGFGNHKNFHFLHFLLFRLLHAPPPERECAQRIEEHDRHCKRISIWPVQERTKAALKHDVTQHCNHLYPWCAQSNRESNTVGADNQGTYRDGTDATRLRADHTTHGANASVDVVIQDELGNLSGLSTPSFPAHHQHTVRVDKLNQLLGTERWKQMRGKTGFHLAEWITMRKEVESNTDLFFAIRW